MKLSVLLNTYNHAGFVLQAIESVLTQRVDFPFDITVLDDASTDDTCELILQYVRQFKRDLTIVRNEKNLGISIRGNERWWEVLRSTSGQYVALLEGDDCWIDPQKLQKQVTFLDNNPDFVLCGHNNINRYEPSNIEHPRHSFAADFTPSLEQLFTAGNILHLSSLVYRNGTIPEFPYYFLESTFVDWPLQILLGQVGRVRILADVMSMYRIHAGGAWSGRYRVLSQEGAPMRAEGYALIIRFWELLNRHLDYKYELRINECIERAYQEIARIEAG